jgi:hypothetical protein
MSSILTYYISSSSPALQVANVVLSHTLQFFFLTSIAGSECRPFSHTTVFPPHQQRGHRHLQIGWMLNNDLILKQKKCWKKNQFGLKSHDNGNKNNYCILFLILLKRQKHSRILTACVSFYHIYLHTYIAFLLVQDTISACLHDQVPVWRTCLSSCLYKRPMQILCNILSSFR